MISCMRAGLSGCSRLKAQVLKACMTFSGATFFLRKPSAAADLTGATGFAGARFMSAAG